MAYPVRVEKPNPVFAGLLQQAIGGIEGEIRVMLQYLFQAWGFRGPMKYRDMLYNTGTEEIGHIEMLATAVALNLEGAPTQMQEEVVAQNPVVGAIMGGMNPRHVISTALAATAEDSNGNPFNGSWVVATGNLASDMYANVTAETSGRLLVTRLWEWTDDPGMKDTLSFLIARDTMHQNQWLAVIEELQQPLPVPSDFTNEHQQFSYQYFVQSTAPIPENARFAQGSSIDGKGEFSTVAAKPLGSIPTLAPAPAENHSLVLPKNGSAGPDVVSKQKKEVFGIVEQFTRTYARVNTFYPGIVILTLLTAGAHFYLGMQPDEELHTWFLLNGLGYLILLAAFVLPPFTAVHAMTRWILLGYTALTILLWIFLGSPKEGKLDPFDVLVKSVEIFLLLFLFLDWRVDSKQRS